MNGISSDRCAAHIRAISCRAFCLALLVGAASPLHAQQMPMYGAGGYPPAYGQPSAAPNGYYYPQSYPQMPQPKGVYYGEYPGMATAPNNANPQPMQRAQNIYYGNYQNNTVPGYIYPRNYQAPNVPNYGGGGITYYYVQDQRVPAVAAPYGAGPAGPRMPAQTQAWPVPARSSAGIPPYTPITADELDDGRKPVVQFHRAPNDNCWVKADYIAMFVRPMVFGGGPLVTLGSPNDNAPGALGQPGTSVVFGNDDANFKHSHGLRLAAGMFLDHDARYSIEIGGFVSLPVTQEFSTGGDAAGNPTISRPIFNTQSGLQGAFLNSLPGTISGTLDVENRTEMWGLEFNARYHGYLRERVHVDGLLGFRVLRLAERTEISEHINPISNTFLTFLGNFVTPPNSLSDFDSFRTVNQFYGPQIGGRVSYEHRWLTADAFLKLGFGITEQHTSIDGTTTLVSPNGQVARGGILALPSNIGTYNRTVFGLIPELGFNVGVDLNCHVRLNVGYSFLMWNQVVRPGSQYDRNVNPSQVPGNPTFGNNFGGQVSPVYRFNEEFFWTHTFNFGVEVRY